METCGQVLVDGGLGLLLAECQLLFPGGRVFGLHVFANVPLPVAALPALRTQVRLQVEVSVHVGLHLPQKLV